MLEYVLINTMLWAVLILSSIGLVLLILYTVKKERSYKQNKAQLLPVVSGSPEWKDWHAGQHFGERFYSPQHRSYCVIVKVESRDRWYYATEKEPEVVKRSRIPITRILGELQ